MEEQKFSFSGSFQKTKEYIETQLELVRLNALAKASRIAGALILDASKLLLTLLVVFFLSMALGFFLGELMNSNALGFLTTGLLFLIFLFIVKACTSKLEVKFMDMIIARIMSKWNEDLDMEEEIKAAYTSNMDKAKETQVEDFYEKDIDTDEKKN